MAGEKGKAVVNLGPGIPWEIREYPVPDPEPDAIVTRITMSSICGSDIHMYKGDFGRPPGAQRNPRIPGHEFVGRVHKLGSSIKTDFTGQPLKEGDRVVWSYYVPCGKCPSCLSEPALPCPNRHRHAGTNHDEYPHFKGAFAEYYYVSPGQWIYRVPDAVPDEATMTVEKYISGLGKSRIEHTDRLGNMTFLFVVRVRNEEAEGEDIIHYIITTKYLGYKIIYDGTEKK